jgi:hypothetical protein
MVLLGREGERERERERVERSNHHTLMYIHFFKLKQTVDI